MRARTKNYLLGVFIGGLVILGVGLYNVLFVGGSVGFGLTTSTPGNGTTATFTVTETVSNTTTITITTTDIVTYTTSRPPGSVGWVEVDALDPEMNPIRVVFLSIAERVVRYLNITVFEPRETFCKVTVEYIVTFLGENTITYYPMAIYDPNTKFYSDVNYGSKTIKFLKDVYDIIGWKGRGRYIVYVGVKIEYPDGTVLENFRWAKLTGYWDGSKLVYEGLDIIDMNPIVGGH